MFEGLTGLQIILLLAATAAIFFYLGRLTTAWPPEAQVRYKRMAEQAAVDDFARLAPDQRAEVDRLVAAGQTIDAIKLVRATLGVGLSEAKQIVDLRRSN